MTEEQLLNRAQEVIHLGHHFLNVFDKFNEDMEPYMENIANLVDTDDRFDEMEDQFIILMQRLTVKPKPTL
jgi:hypothetical protein